jgi:hypothetical protein
VVWCCGEAKSYGGEKAWSSINRSNSGRDKYSEVWPTVHPYGFLLRLLLLCITHLLCHVLLYNPSAAGSLYCCSSLLLFITLLLCHVPLYHPCVSTFHCVTYCCIDLLMCFSLQMYHVQLYHPPPVYHPSAVSRTAIYPSSMYHPSSVSHTAV